jgi:hypothetical protein
LLQFIKSLSNSINIKFRFSIQWSENPVQGWVKGREFPVIFHRQVFTNKDDSTGTLYRISNDLSASVAPLETIYQKRWKVEVFHKSIEANTSME